MTAGAKFGRIGVDSSYIAPSCWNPESRGCRNSDARLFGHFATLLWPKGRKYISYNTAGDLNSSDSSNLYGALNNGEIHSELAFYSFTEERLKWFEFVHPTARSDIGFFYSRQLTKRREEGMLARYSMDKDKLRDLVSALPLRVFVVFLCLVLVVVLARRWGRELLRNASMCWLHILVGVAAFVYQMNVKADTVARLSEVAPFSDLTDLLPLLREGHVQLKFRSPLATTFTRINASHHSGISELRQTFATNPPLFKALGSRRNWCQEVLSNPHAVFVAQTYDNAPRSCDTSCIREARGFRRYFPHLWESPILGRAAVRQSEDSDLLERAKLLSLRTTYTSGPQARQLGYKGVRECSPRRDLDAQLGGGFAANVVWLASPLLPACLALLALERALSLGIGFLTSSELHEVLV